MNIHLFVLYKSSEGFSFFFFFSHKKVFLFHFKQIMEGIYIYKEELKEAGACQFQFMV